MYVIVFSFNSVALSVFSYGIWNIDRENWNYRRSIVTLCQQWNIQVKGEWNEMEDPVTGEYKNP